MSEEKVIYEVGVQGVGSTISQINSIAGALAGVEKAGQQAVASLSGIGEAVSAQLPLKFTSFKEVINTFDEIKWKAGLFAGSTHPGGKLLFQDYKQRFVDLQRYLNKKYLFTDEEKNRINQYANFFGVGKITEADKAGIRANLAQINPLWKVNENWDYSHYFIPHMLFGEGWRIGDNPYATFDGSNTEKLKSRTAIRKKERQETHEYAERIRAANRAKWGPANEWSSIASEFPLVPFGDGLGEALNAARKREALNAARKRRILNAGKAQLSQNNANIKNFGNLVASFGGGGGGIGGGIGKGLAAIGGASAAFGVIGAAIALAIPILIKIAKKIKQFLRSLSKAGWSNVLESNAFGIRSDELQAQRSAIMRLSGDPASASALMKRLSVDRAMIAYGGSGGSAMEAARLFGVNILGSGEYGFATNSEFMRNVAKRMETLSQSGKVALGNLLGLDKEQMWQVSRGVTEYDKITNAKTSRQEAYGLDSIHSDWYKLTAQDAELAYGRWKNALEEFKSVLGEWLNPVAEMFTNAGSSILEWLSKIMSPSYAYSIKSAEAITRDGRVANIHIDTISLNSLGLPDSASPEQIREKLTEQILNPLGEALVDDRM